MNGPALLAALKQALDFRAAGNRAGNVTVGTGTLDARKVHVALVENHLASGSIGTHEAKKLVAVMKIAAMERSPLVIYLDSAGAKVSEGLAALGAFRRVFRAGLDAACAGVPVAVVLGKNAYGGSSMLAHLASARLFNADTQLAMSGPSILAAAAGMSALDEMFKTMAGLALTAEARSKANPVNQRHADGMDLADWLRKALGAKSEGFEGLLRQHKARHERLPGREPPAGVPLMRKDLARLFPEGYEADESDGLVTGVGKREGREEAILGLVSRTPVGAERAYRFAERAWRLVAKKATHVHVILDCESHAARIEDEKIVLSEYIVGMSYALTALRISGAHIEMTILDRAGGGVYVALAAPATHVSVVYGAHVQVLPGAAIAAILGETNDAEPDKEAIAKEAITAGVADAQLKLGIIEAI
ncbi:carboxyl transferase domain-containing protein [Usitatibacter palustris]|uniref:Acetyl-coenzyme A carboxylase carboxyl transferase subunit beta domain-containing protein n=1 Tax=Usitatibacter palustris TaxID=2732487 RepID=A0A6M4HAV7_9PROT|nr:carboxyl transferase domain-containing protein [Usitatibacter palustris]QJR15167.1 hypothetical protein DSM104440_01984 [Usitatibacter palustris]